MPAEALRMSDKLTVVVFGMGEVGFGLVRELARLPGLRVVACRRNDQEGSKDVNLLTVAGEVMGQHSDIRFESVDISELEQVRKILERYQPDLVFQCATALSYLRVRQLPSDISDTLLHVGIGWTAPMNIQYPIVVGRAIKELGLSDSTVFVNASTPDYTNVVLDRLGLPIDCGIGNIGGGRVSMIAYGAAARLGVAREDLTVRAAFPHAVAAALRENKSTGGHPYYLNVRYHGADVTTEVDPDESLRGGWPKIPSLGKPQHGYPLAVASSTAVISGILYDTHDITHVPGANGLPGGWPVKLQRDGVDVVVPPGAAENDLRDVNNAGLRGDGIEEIKTDGTIVFTEQSREAVRNALGYDCAVLAPEDLANRRSEIAAAITSIE